MDALLHAGLTNAAWATALALAAAIGARIWRRHPAAAHVLWLLVLLKLVTPSLIQVGQDARRYVLVVNSQDIVEKRLVRVGLLYNGLREVKDGLKTEDRVIIAGPGHLSVGWKVFPQPEHPEAGSSLELDRPGAQRR